MNVARILYPVEVLGPGKRLGIWVCGCRRGCKGCSNPELWVQKPEYEVTVEDIMSLVSRISDLHKIDGFTISGGEPMDQPEGLSQLITQLSAYSKDILIYTGYRIDELKKREDPATNIILSRAAVLIDGEYREEENMDVLLRGSSNQRIHILIPEMAEGYEKYLASAHNQIQNFTTLNGVVSVGIHRKGFSG
ncbi:radical SAM domain protein [Oribacterium sp. oral taxon 078 str. F0263]|uniref:4Fe-4S single cluster domain-containing protein n=1 Tax=Oribacterium sp. oral taxon 078 TaxID=652706 RepID=UPI0003ADF338|nr:radical SAM domain protein [Oribacterium sp. oral taxon 078 str. F0263]